MRARPDCRTLLTSPFVFMNYNKCNNNNNNHINKWICHFHLHWFIRNKRRHVSSMRVFTPFRWSRSILFCWFAAFLIYLESSRKQPHRYIRLYINFGTLFWAQTRILSAFVVWHHTQIRGEYFAWYNCKRLARGKTSFSTARSKERWSLCKIAKSQIELI